VLSFNARYIIVLLSFKVKAIQSRYDRSASQPLNSKKTFTIDAILNLFFGVSSHYHIGKTSRDLIILIIGEDILLDQIGMCECGHC